MFKVRDTVRFHARKQSGRGIVIKKSMERNGPWLTVKFQVDGKDSTVNVRPSQCKAAR